MNRTRFDISGSSPFSDTGPPINGAIMQMRWYPTTSDTGGDIAIDLMPSTAPSDTGFAMTIYSDANCLGSAFTRVPTQATHDATGGVASANVPIVAAGERLRVRITPGVSVAGKLWVWWAE